MSTNLNYKQVANVERRTWDLETYSKRAIERQKNAEGDSGTIMKKKKTKGGMPDTGGSGDGSGPGGDEEGLQQWKEEFQPAPKGAAGPEKSDRAFLKARRNKVDVDSKIGSVEIINPDAVATTKSIVGEPGSIKDGITKSGVGWHCKVCDCFLRDSLAYLDHINGRKHQRNLGFSMRVERSTQDQVSSKLAMLVKEKEKKKKKQQTMFGDENTESFDALVLAKDEEAQRRKEERARQRKERKKLKKLQSQVEPSDGDDEEEEQQKQPPTNHNEEQNEEVAGVNDDNCDDDEEEEVEEDELNPDIAAMMGFSGFK